MSQDRRTRFEPRSPPRAARRALEHLTAELKLSQPSEVASYVAFFNRLAEVARYGAEARVLITRALADLMATT